MSFLPSIWILNDRLETLRTPKHSSWMSHGQRHTLRQPHKCPLTLFSTTECKLQSVVWSSFSSMHWFAIEALISDMAAQSADSKDFEISWVDFSVIRSNLQIWPLTAFKVCIWDREVVFYIGSVVFSVSGFSSYLCAEKCTEWKLQKSSFVCL